MNEMEDEENIFEIFSKYLQIDRSSVMFILAIIFTLSFIYLYFFQEKFLGGLIQFIISFAESDFLQDNLIDIPYKRRLFVGTQYEPSWCPKDPVRRECETYKTFGPLYGEYYGAKPVLVVGHRGILRNLMIKSIRTVNNVQYCRLRDAYGNAKAPLKCVKFLRQRMVDVFQKGLGVRCPQKCFKYMRRCADELHHIDNELFTRTQLVDRTLCVNVHELTTSYAANVILTLCIKQVKIKKKSRYREEMEKHLNKFTEWMSASTHWSDEWSEPKVPRRSLKFLLRIVLDTMRHLKEDEDVRDASLTKALMRLLRTEQENFEKATDKEKATEEKIEHAEEKEEVVDEQALAEAQEGPSDETEIFSGKMDEEIELEEEEKMPESETEGERSEEIVTELEKSEESETDMERSEEIETEGEKSEKSEESEMDEEISPESEMEEEISPESETEGEISPESEREEKKRPTETTSGEISPTSETSTERESDNTGLKPPEALKRITGGKDKKVKRHKRQKSGKPKRKDRKAKKKKKKEIKKKKGGIFWHAEPDFEEEMTKVTEAPSKTSLETESKPTTVDDDEDYEDEDVAAEELKKRAKSRIMSNKTLAANIVFFMYKMYQPVALTITHSLFVLSNKQDIQSQLREEILTCWKQPAILSRNAISKMKLLNYFIQEILRMYPPYTKIEYSTRRLLHFETFTIPPDSHLCLPIYGIHHSPDNFNDPETFNLYRFENYKGHALSYMPFGAGDRICMGKIIAEYMIEVALCFLLSEYEISLPECSEDLSFTPRTVLLRPAKPIYMNFRRILPPDVTDNEFLEIQRKIAQRKKKLSEADKKKAFRHEQRKIETKKKRLAFWKEQKSKDFNIYNLSEMIQENEAEIDKELKRTLVSWSKQSGYFIEEESGIKKKVVEGKKYDKGKRKGKKKKKPKAQQKDIEEESQEKE